MDIDILDRFSGFDTGLEERARASRLRVLEELEAGTDAPYATRDGRRFLNFSSNDYLGLASDPDVVAGAVRAAKRYGAGSGASRLVTGSLEIHGRLESELARFTGRPSALLFNSGFQANASIIPAVSDRKGLVLADKLSHASVLHGCRAAGAAFKRFRHNDPDHLERLLVEHDRPAGSAVLIVTESVFSMDGDRAPLREICEVADRHEALLMVDDAHAIGVFGRQGEGLAASHARVDLLLGTFGKAFGAAGAFVACNETLRAHLVNFCAGFVYSTAPPPPVLGAVAAALSRIRSGALDRERFLAFVAEAHVRLRAEGFDTSPSDTHIIPIRLGEDEAVLRCAEFLKERGILAVPIRPPTVPRGTARLRISLTRLHTPAHLEELVEALRAERDARPDNA